MNRRFNVDFIKKFPIFLAISGSIILIGIVLSFVVGVKIDIHFSGGTIITYSYDGEVDFDAVAESVSESVNAEARVTGATGAEGGENFIVTLVGTKSIGIEEQEKLTDDLGTEFKDNNISFVEGVSVNASNGRDFFIKCLAAVLFAFLVLVLFVGIRFRKIGGWSAGVCGIIALLHDALIVYVTCVIFGFAISETFMAVILVILGYSLNDTIVVFDRIRENRTDPDSRLSIEQCVNLSINQCLSRCIATSVTTISSMLIIVIVSAVFGVFSIVSFGIPLLAGLISGTFSSICFGAPLWMFWRKKAESK
ncbi:MAG: protein translocase subunit SecF [Oscillospiraceae bacterium]|nr:protein translocase subunit SecF [Oscillospiraceae bacterium]